jgi:hypothetical protein
VAQRNADGATAAHHHAFEQCLTAVVNARH